MLDEVERTDTLIHEVWNPRIVQESRCVIEELDMCLYIITFMESQKEIKLIECSKRVVVLADMLGIKVGDQATHVPADLA